MNINRILYRNRGTQRLSLVRAFILLAGIGSLIFMSATNATQIKDTLVQFAAPKDDPWFASYVDVTAVPTFSFENIDKETSSEVVLSFIVASSQDGCTPTWGNAFTLDQAGNNLDLDRRIARLRQRGGDIAISFGGEINDELAVACKDEVKLKTAYEAVIERYNIDTIDLDLEGYVLTDTEAGARRARVIAQIQKEKHEKNQQLAVWVTLPVIPQGLTEDGTNAITDLLENNVDLSGVNIMTMNYGQSLESGHSMYEGSKDALNQTHRQLEILYERTGIFLSSKSLWAKIGATPMIGQNNITEEVFTLDDAEKLNDFAKSKNLARLSMWSANRDIACGDNYVNVKIVSDSCSGLEEPSGTFAQTLGKDFTGNLRAKAADVTKSDRPANEEIVDDPSASPYAIWSESASYLEGTKVVWKRNVYEAKWWTKGDSPNNPVLNAYETPWELVGPVLPGETPIQQPTLPEGTYPEWSGEKNYKEGTLILFEKIPYRAKWWNQGQSPAASSSDPDGSPWIALTEAEIAKIKSKLE